MSDQLDFLVRSLTSPFDVVGAGDQILTPPARFFCTIPAECRRVRTVPAIL